jgi:PAS domain S-box-containing protein
MMGCEARRPIDMSSSPESSLKPDRQIQLSVAARVVRPAGPESKQGPNTTTPSQAESLLAAEKRTLEMMANGASLSEVLNDLCEAIDAHASPVTSMVCLLKGEWLVPCAGPHVPATFKAAITPWRIGPDRASCGAAAFTKQRVIVPNISNDPRWPDDARELALSHGFSAAWSEPLISKDGEVLGTFAMYYPEPRTPLGSDFELINSAGHIALIAIELERSHRALKNALVEIENSENRLRAIIDTIPALAWSARPDGSAEFFNRRWLDYTGLSADQARDWGWTLALHSEDLNKLVDYWRSVLASGEPGEVEGRLRRFDGVYRWFLFRATPSFDNHGRVVKWFGTNTDIEDRKRAECLLAGENLVLEMTAKASPLESILEALCRVVEQTASGCCCSVVLIDRSGSTIQQAVAPSLPSSYNDRFPGTAVDREGGPCTEAARRKIQVIVPDIASDTRWDTYGWRTAALTHGLKACWSTTILASSGLVLGTFAIYWREPRSPTEQDEEIIGQITHLAAVAIERKRNEAALQESEERFRLIVDTIPGFVCTLNATGEVELLNRRLLEYFGKTTEELKNWSTSDAIHPDDLPQVIDAWRRSVETGQPYDLELRQRRADGVYRWFQSRALPTRDTEGHITGWYMLLTDIDDRKLAEDALRASEQDFRLIVDSVPGLVWTMTADGEVELVNQQILGYFGTTLDEMKEWTLFLHPDDRARVMAYWRGTTESGQAYDVEHRLRRADGAYRWFQARGLPHRDAQGRIVRWYNLLTDIDERKRAEDALRRSEAYLSEAQRLSHTGSFGCKVPSGEMFWSEETFRIFAYDRTTKPAVEAILERVHPEDKALVQERIDRATGEGKDCDLEYRLLLPDSSIKHVHVVAHAVTAEPGGFEFVGSVMDVTDQRQARAELEKAFEEIKRLKDRLHDENVVLREQIDQVFMFEEIVGSSPALKTVLSSIVKVAPTDSTVLITGETGTGKELIARAIHKGSQRAGQAFITVNCASIPSSLIASELFGHEKGAFTGALQRRQGRFELAHSGTIFLDEIGELPAETQIALLRVLQERQFERVGGSRVIPTDVRIIAATNRDLVAAIASGSFRADLFYRLNVFPIDVPPLRERKEDIPMLVEYFVKRYAEKARKQITKIDKKTLKLCQSYHWPGNIRELQNIIERSVILCTGDTFVVDESWLSSQDVPRPKSTGLLTETLQSYERELITAALAESNGKVAGPNGAAAKLGIPRSTLDLKIKQLYIKKPGIR